MNHQDRRAQRRQSTADCTVSIDEGPAAARAALSPASLHPESRTLNLHRTRRLAQTASARARQTWAIARKRRPKLRALARAAAPGQPVSLRRFRLGALLACGVLSAALHSAWAAPVVIQNQFLRVGISEMGTLGTGGSAPPGILYDHTGSGNFSQQDLLVPQTPIEGFVLSSQTAGSCNIPYPLGGPAARHCQFSLNSSPSGSSFATPTSPVLLSPSSATWSAVALDGEMAITHQYDLFSAGALSVIGVTTTVTALRPINDELYFLRYMDADPDGALSSPIFPYATFNGPLSDHLACSTSAASTLTVCINTSSPLPHRSLVAQTSFPLDPLLYLSVSPPWNNGFGDHGLGMSFNLGTFAAGQSKTFGYEYFVGGAPLTAAVPEPGSMALVGLALSALGLVRRKSTGLMKPGVGL